MVINALLLDVIAFLMFQLLVQKVGSEWVEIVTVCPKTTPRGIKPQFNVILMTPLILRIRDLVLNLDLSENSSILQTNTKQSRFYTGLE